MGSRVFMISFCHWGTPDWGRKRNISHKTNFSKLLNRHSDLVASPQPHEQLLLVWVGEYRPIAEAANLFAQQVQSFLKGDRLCSGLLFDWLKYLWEIIVSFEKSHQERPHLLALVPVGAVEVSQDVRGVAQADLPGGDLQDGHGAAEDEATCREKS